MTKEKQLGPDGDGVTSKDSAQTLRKRAEGIARGKAFRRPEHLESLSIEATRQALHELQVHQIEMEMQNEELRRIQGELDASRARYFDLYDLAPVGYFTLNEQGLILEANLTAATQMGVARSALVKQPLSRFILPEDQDIHYRHRKLLFETGAPQVFELRLVKKDAAPFWARIDATAAQGADGAPLCRATLIDITERKKTEARVGSLVAMLDAAPASITVHDFDGRFHYANRKTFDMHGYEDSEFMALRLHDLDVPESAALIAERMQLIKEKGEATFEASHFHKNGVAIQMEVFVKVVEWQGASALLSIASDITERKLAEEAVRKSEEKYRNLFDNALEGVYQSTPEGRLISANMAFARMFGYASPEDIFNTVTDIASQMYANPDDRKIAVGILMETGQIKDFECRMRRKDGSIFWARFDGRFTKTKYGKPCFQGFVIDITERKQAEEAVQNARWFLQRVQDALSFHIAILDEAGVIVQVNTAWRNFGKQNDLQHPNSCIGQSYLDVCEQASGPDSEEALLVAQAIRDLLAGRQDRAAIEYPCHAPYEERWFVVHITRFDDNHRWIVVAHENITDRKQIEEEIRKMNDELESRVRGRTAQLEASNKALEAFSSSVSHDLRAPLRSIEGFSHAILEEYREKLDETGQNYLDRVCGAARRMGQLIDDTLKLSRVARFDFQCAAVDLSRMVREIAEAHQQSNPDRVVDVNVQEGIIVQGDRHLMKIAMENLVGNAFKFTGKAAHPQIEFGKTIKDDEIAYYVRDNGAGFDMAYVDKLFGPFQRLHTAEEFAGTGIGLATVQRIIARHGGRVWAEGEAGKGATFYFTLCAPIA